MKQAFNIDSKIMLDEHIRETDKPIPPHGMYRKCIFLIVIPIVSMLISLICSLADPNIVFNNFGVFLLKGLIPTSIIWAGCMGIVTLFWKIFPWEQHPVKHLIYEVVSILLYLTLLLFWQLILIARLDFETWKVALSKEVLSIFNTVLITFLITVIHEAFYFYRQWKANFSKSIGLEKDNLQAQYNTLKAQINPHFLFNSLNSLISLVEGNPKAEKFIQDLSEYTRFVLLSSEHETVTLRDELDNLERYIGLMSIRFGNNLTVSTEVKPAALKMEVPPLVLQILMENCVKHNIITNANHLHISIEANEQSVTVTNNLQKKSDSGSTGQGLANIKGRYRFSSAEEVKISVTEDTFSVKLPLILPKNKMEQDLVVKKCGFGIVSCAIDHHKKLTRI